MQSLPDTTPGVREQMDRDWIRLRKGRAKLNPSATILLKILIMFWDEEAAKARLGAHQRHQRGAIDAAAGLRAYWEHAQGHLRHLLVRIQQSLPTNELESLYDAYMSLSQEQRDGQVALDASLDVRPVSELPPGHSGSGGASDDGAGIAPVRDGRAAKRNRRPSAKNTPGRGPRKPNAK